MKAHGLRFAALSAAVFAFGLALGAQQTTPAPAPAAHPETLAQRKQNQQNRIANGINSGQLTANETTHLERREAHLSAETRTMRNANGGKLTAADRARLNRQYNGLSRGVYQDKHNAATAHYGNGRIGQRRENQQDRIAQGVRSGSLTAREAASTERQQRSINRQTNAMRRRDGGQLNAAQRARINRRQNRASRHIYRAKHNASRR